MLCARTTNGVSYFCPEWTERLIYFLPYFRLGTGFDFLYLAFYKLIFRALSVKEFRCKGLSLLLAGRRGNAPGPART